MENQSFNQLNSCENDLNFKVVRGITKSGDITENSLTYDSNKHLPKEVIDINKYFSNSFHSLIQVDAHQCIKNFTPGAIDQVNMRGSDLGRPLSDLTHHIKNFDLVEAVQSVIDSKKTLYEQVETTKEKWFYLLITPVIEYNGNETGGANISFHDITQLTLSKLQVDKDNLKLSRINKDHENFIYSVSHDLKSPLNSMEALVSLINRSDNMEGIKELSTYLMKSVAGLRNTINELSNITDIEKELDGKDSVKLPELIGEIKWSLRDLLNDAFAIVNIELAVDEINFCKKNLRSILYNFLCNAIKYKSNNRQLKIDITTREEDSFVVLSITDNGMGISDSQIETIFSKFKRIDAGENNIEGSGIGLFLVKRIVSNAGVDMKVRSEVNRGTTFEVYFPMK
jgi:two-component system CheB/CheR fusion protein